MNNRLVISSTIGFMCIGLTLWMLNLGDAGWVSGGDPHGMAMGFGLCSVVLGVIAILTFFHGRTIDAVIFFGFAGGFWTMNHLRGAGGSGGSEGWFWLVWAIFFFYVWLSSFKAGWARSLFLLATWIALLAMCLLGWTGMGFFHYIDGYVGLFAGLVATYISAAEILNHGCGKVVLQTGSKDS
ncbi:MAG: hypothetical protein WCC11_05950 [Gammaproteobacteria bacterium]